MPRHDARSDPDRPDDTLAELTRRLGEEGIDATPAQLQKALQELLGLGPMGADPFDLPPPPSRRRPRRDDVVTYRVRVDLRGTKPPLWRRLELASDLYLHEVHHVLQVAFGWLDGHLHRFGSGPSRYGPETEHYLGPWEAEEGESPGIPEDQVRLDEVLVEPGDVLFYDYDYGDGWEHTIKLEAVEARAPDAVQAVCTAGRRPGPPEDCGGVYGYELIVAATDPANPGHAEAAAEFADMYGPEVDPHDFRLTPFEPDTINELLADLDEGAADAARGGLAGGVRAVDADAALPPRLQELAEAVRFGASRDRLREMLAAADLGAPILIDAAVATRMVRPYTWLLDRVGDDGLKLTGAGYLPPVHVSAAVDELGISEEWIGKGNREVQTLPVLHLRESAQKTGLLRKHRGTLSLTARGREVRRDPVAVWWQLAARMPLPSRDAAEEQAGLLLLTAVAARQTDDLTATIADFLGAIGWMMENGSALTPSAANHAAFPTQMVLRRLGGFATGDEPWRRSDEPTDEGVTFARAALVTWPG